MGISYSADLGYGFIVPKQMCEDMKPIEHFIDENEDLDLMFHGDDYEVVLIIKDSHQHSYAYKALLPLNPLNNSQIDEWNMILKKAAQTLQIDQPKISWYLCSSVS